ncbi:MAG: hypothetical protein WD669_02860 [Pirellulales bacterium]
MAIALYFDVHVDRAIVGQLRLREVESLTAQEDGSDRRAMRNCWNVPANQAGLS